MNESHKTNIMVPGGCENIGDKRYEEPATDVAPRELPEEKQMGGPLNCNHLELCTFLLGLEAEFLPTSYSDTDQYAGSKSKNIQEGCYSKEWKTDASLGSPCLETLKSSMENHGEDQLMLFAEDSPARILVQRVKEQELPEHVRDCGRSMQESLTKFGLSMSLPKTLHCFALGDLPLSSKTWPTWGMMQDGECWELGMRVRHIKETECGYLPTPLANDYRNVSSNIEYHKKRLAAGRDFTSKIAVHFGTRGKVNPICSEIAMMWPRGWTDLKPLGMDKFRQWQHSHGRC